MEAASTVSLKLIVNTTNQTVLFAEAGKDFVDFLFYILSLPAGAIAKLLKEDNMPGSLVELYQSIEALSETYIQPNQTKSSILNPEIPMCPKISFMHLSHDESKSRQFYACNNPFARHFYMSDVPNVHCPTCNMSMKGEISYVPPGPASRATDVSEAGFVNGTVNYMVMDNLQVTPITSVISCITLFDKFNLMDFGSVEERVVDFGVDEGLKLLKASMDCKNVLTSVFLGNNNNK